jgi:hypothetical protein
MSGKGLRWAMLTVGLMVAFAAPGVAQATVTDSEGNVAEEVEAVSTNTKWTVNIGGSPSTSECTTTRLALKPTPSEPKHLTGIGVATGHPGVEHDHPECSLSPSGLTMRTTSLTYTIDLAKRTADFSYTYDITHPVIGAIHCTFAATGAAVTYTAGSDAIGVAGAMTGSGGGICPTTASSHGDFTVTASGEPAVID